MSFGQFGNRNAGSLYCSSTKPKGARAHAFDAIALEAKTGSDRGAGSTVGAGGGAKDSGLVFAGGVCAGARV